MRMHACMLASDPPLRYLKGTTLDLMDAVEGLRQSGVGAWYTMDAGPHVKVLCLAKDAEAVAQSLSEIVGAEFSHITRPGTGAQLIEPWTAVPPFVSAPGKVMLFGEYAVLMATKRFWLQWIAILRPASSPVMV